MPTISRRLPKSNKTRNEALSRAKDKQATVPAGTAILSPATVGRLDVIQPDYKAAINLVAVKRAILAGTTTRKAAARVKARAHVSKFIQTFNNGVALGFFPKEHRAFYKLDINSEAVPYLGNDQALITVGRDLIDGDASRIAAGGAAMAIPTIEQVETAYDEFKDAFVLHSTQTDELDAALESVDALSAEADGVIRKVWDEVETFYNEEAIESKRDNAREWGVVYISVGAAPAVISGTMRDAATGETVAGTIYLDGPDETIEVGSDGVIHHETAFVGETLAIADSPEYNQLTKSVTIAEGGSIALDFDLTEITG